MRSILSASLPKETILAIKKEAKARQMSVSAFILHLFEAEKELINEQQLLKRTTEARKNHAEKKTKKLKTLKELM